ncbi:hypothetical protein HDU93_000238 [Gonapodya sp. JEL0774]|nr:hypothetical protein HDU93_000238 [Gonapodya sp. JEL0774]
MNAWTDVNGMSQSVVRAINQFDKDDTVKVVIVTGAGRAFCAGADLSSGGATFSDANPTENPTSGPARTPGNARDGGGQAALAISRCRKVVIGAINGAAVGIGITVTLAMDFRIAYKDAKIGFVFARRGIVPEATSTFACGDELRIHDDELCDGLCVRLDRIAVNGDGKHLPLCGYSRALSLVMTGEVIPASHPHLSLLFHSLAPTPAATLTQAIDLAKTLATKNSAVSMGMAKHMIWRGTGSPEEQHLLDSRVMYVTGNGLDSAEGVQSFLEKREPKFTGSFVKDVDQNPAYDGWYPWWKKVETQGVPNLTEPLSKI